MVQKASNSSLLGKFSRPLLVVTTNVPAATTWMDSKDYGRLPKAIIWSGQRLEKWLEKVGGSKAAY